MTTAVNTSSAKSYAVVYPFGTSSSYEIFDNLPEAKAFVDEEAFIPYYEREEKSLTIFSLPVSKEEAENLHFSAEESYGYSPSIEEFFHDLSGGNQYDIPYQKIDEGYAIKRVDGKLEYVCHITDDIEEELKQELEVGDEIVECYHDMDGVDDIFESAEEFCKFNAPSKSIDF